ncbi:MAG: polyphosphate kinase 1, partial [Gammaproteobacteria bacterium]|nr:polyphosphate kinase 1 [Gammaproteobacteria bacterium]
MNDAGITIESNNKQFDQRFYNRELSLLKFNHRVLAQAEDPQVPLLERLKFLCIVSSNMDEFFEVRVGGLKQKLKLNTSNLNIDGRTTRELAEQVNADAHQLIQKQYAVLNQQLLPDLQQHGIRLKKSEDLDSFEKDWLHDYFVEQVLPILSPIALDPARPFPMLLNKALNFIVRIDGKDAYKRKTNLAIIPIPRSLPRVIGIPSDDEMVFVTLATVIRLFRDLIFPGITIESCHSFRVTRNSDLFLDDEEVDDLLRAVKGKLVTRHYGEAVRLETSSDFPHDIQTYLLELFHLDESDLFKVDGPINMHRLMHLYELCDRPELKYPAFKASMPNALSHQEDYFSVIAERDVLVHHPYQSFATVLEFMRQAAVDPGVLAIKQTLYRTEVDSPVIDALVKAAQNGKEVTVIVELMARFDEARNVELADHLYAAGVHVLYGVVGFKTHAKACLVLRQEEDQLRRYAHLGTGNYHPGTARMYTDYGIFTSNEKITKDLNQLFLQLSSLAPDPDNEILLQAPFFMFNEFLKRIKKCEKAARAGNPSRIIAKINSLTEPNIIEALYKASQAGVKIQLIVRGICCLRARVPGLSENIEVRSIVGRYLEHTRVYYFDYGSKNEDGDKNL